MKDYILKGSAEWDSFISEIMSIKSKSNRQVLCVKCWLLLNYEQKIKHIKSIPDHSQFILTSSKFASSWQISSLALACNKIEYKDDGEYVKSPFQDLNSNNQSINMPEVSSAIEESEGESNNATPKNNILEKAEADENKEEQKESNGTDSDNFILSFLFGFRF